MGNRWEIFRLLPYEHIFHLFTEAGRGHINQFFKNLIYSNIFLLRDETAKATEEGCSWSFNTPKSLNAWNQKVFSHYVPPFQQKNHNMDKVSMFFLPSNLSAEWAPKVFFNNMQGGKLITVHPFSSSSRCSSKIYTSAPGTCKTIGECFLTCNCVWPWGHCVLQKSLDYQAGDA